MRDLVIVGMGSLGDLEEILLQEIMDRKVHQVEVDSLRDNIYHLVIQVEHLPISRI